MLTLALSNSSLLINGKEFKFPIPVTNLTDHLGPARRTVKKYNTIYAWDDLGFTAHTQDDKSVQRLMVQYSPPDYDYAAKTGFKGSLTFHGEQALSYYAANKNKLEKLFKDDDSGAFIFNDISAWFYLDDDKPDRPLLGIQISAYEGKALKKPTMQVPLDKEFSHFEKLWLDWIETIQSIVPTENKYFNLTSGISSDAIQTALKNKAVKIPTTLINFYKVRNVDYNAVTSVFKFDFNGWTYDLLPFEDIISNWEEIQDLQSEDDEDEYANPNWIPFAESRQGDYLLIDPSHLQIIELQNETWKRNVVAASIEDLIKNEIKTLKNGNTSRFEFILSKN